jgi:fibronectin type 3 domain-containing protein
MDYQQVTIETLNGGVIAELFEEKLAEILENIADPNTPWKTKRRIQIAVDFEPNEDRTNATTTVSVQTKVAPVKPHSSFVVLGSDGSRVSAYTTDPREQQLPFGDGKVRDIQ